MAASKSNVSSDPTDRKRKRKLEEAFGTVIAENKQNAAKRLRSVDKPNVLQLIFDTEMDDILNDISSFNQSERDQLLLKLKEMQNVMEQGMMVSLRFDDLKDPRNYHERERRLKPFVKCITSSIANGDEPGGNYHHVTTDGEFEIGPTGLRISFECSIGNLESDILDGNMSFGDLWEYDCDGESNKFGSKLKINIDGIKQFVKQCLCGFKGIGKDQGSAEDSNVKSRKKAFYGYIAFAHDLTSICFDLIEKQNGNQNVFGDLSDDFNVLGDFEEPIEEEIDPEYGN